MQAISEKPAKSARGRPKIFNRERVLDKAMMQFWAYGYEGTSLSHLVDATGAKAPTLYAEFGNKEGLFRAAMDRYLEVFEDLRKGALDQSEYSVSQGIEVYLRSTARSFTDKSKPAGCFVICNSMVLAASSTDVAKMLRKQHHTQEAILETYLQVRQQRQELPTDVDVSAIARYLSCLLQGMSVRAREGATLAELEEIIATFMGQWPALTGLTYKG
ncbi:TPA: TetR/AcrR family transcriptional regulator [Serratia marcescens]|nr:TetR/AcrR family transcriptional regulator [Serratia marcescens]HBK4673030.1 TetR/AcrR family transcriptional regulator [Serratia marcescens]